MRIEEKRARKPRAIWELPVKLTNPEESITRIVSHAPIKQMYLSFTADGTNSDGARIIGTPEEFKVLQFHIAKMLERVGDAY